MQPVHKLHRKQKGDARGSLVGGSAEPKYFIAAKKVAKLK